MTTDRIEEKIRKLLQLAGNNPSIEEAAVAFARAQDLATAHGLELDDIMQRAEADEAPPPPREVGAIVVEQIETWGKAVAWKCTLGYAISRANNCESYRNQGGCTAPDPGYCFYGQAADVETARYIYLAIVAEVEAMAKRAVAAYAADPEVDPRWDASPRIYGRSWRMGCADAIARRMPTPAKIVEAKRLEIQQARAKALGMGSLTPEGFPGGSSMTTALAVATNALVRVDQAAQYVSKVEDALKHHGKKVLGLRSASGFAGASSSDGYAAGRAAGESVNIGVGTARALKGGH